MAIRLLIADDHVVVRQGLRLFLSLDPDIDVLDDEAATGLEAVALARRTRPDVILMDVLMPDLDGISATRILRVELPDVRIVALTGMLDPAPSASVVAAVRAGAAGYLLKTSDPGEVRAAVHAVAGGEVYFSPTAAKRLIGEVTSPADDGSLTPREVQVLVLLAKGLANKEIARELRIGLQTVKTYVSNIIVKLGVRSRTEAALHALQVGLVDSG